MTGDEEYIKARAAGLVSTFSSILSKELKLQDFPNGCTDCATFIRAPLSNPEGYLVVEHELSHNLFGTDLVLTEAFREKAVERLLRRAGIQTTHPDAAPYKGKLNTLVHHLWNVLEDHRVRWLWSILYPGGGAFLGQRWHDIAEYEFDEQQCETDLLSYLGRRAAGVETTTAPDRFRECGKQIIKAKNLVEGVDAEACLAITARLIDDIADDLLERYPPNKTQEAKAKLNALCQNIGGGLNGGQEQGDPIGNPMGGRDISEPEGKKRRPTASQLKRINQVLTAKDDDESKSVDGMSSFAALLDSGAEKMEAKLEAARNAMSLPKMSNEEQGEDILLSACKAAGVKSEFVVPTKMLPKPSQAAARIRQHLERVHMRKRLSLAEEGDDVDVEAYIEAKLNKELDSAKLFRREKKETGMELLLLGDLSGSMTGFGLDLLEQAMSDIVFSCTNLRVKVDFWGFSDAVFFFKKLGSPKEARGVRYGCTNMVQALDVAYEWAKASKSTRAVILMTDGMPTSLRGRRSTGDLFKDLNAVLTEMRHDGVILSILAIGPESSRQYYDIGFGPGNYGLLENILGLGKALPDTAKKLVEAHLNKGRS
jgi:hypothetical protein